MGTSREQVLRIFLIQGGAMGFAGSVLGSLPAWGFLLVWRGVAKNPDRTPMFIVDAQPTLFIIAAIAATAVGIRGGRCAVPLTVIAVTAAKHAQTTTGARRSVAAGKGNAGGR